MKWALAYNPFVRWPRIAPIVNGGIVTLRGTVDDLRTWQSATLNARNSGDLFDVDDGVMARPATALCPPRTGRQWQAINPQDRVIPSLARSSFTVIERAWTRTRPNRIASSSRRMPASRSLASLRLSTNSCSVSIRSSVRASSVSRSTSVSRLVVAREDCEELVKGKRWLHCPIILSTQIILVNSYIVSRLAQCELNPLDGMTI